jgi:hypothetical protein
MGSAVEELLEQFKGEWAFVQSLKASGREETLHLDFKRKSRPREAGLDKADRQHLSKALSGFANSEGGLLVWGIDARKKDGIDRVQGIEPIEHLNQFASELNTVTPEMVSGPVPGVEHRKILASGGADEGIVVTAIPQSDATPHMATGPELHRYYRRASDRFQEMEHYEVADMFGRRPHPDLRVEPFWEMQGPAESPQIILQFMVSNRGRGVAEFPCLTIGNPPKFWKAASATGLDTGGPFLPTDAPHGWYKRYSGTGHGVIYPGDRFNVASIVFPVSDIGQQGPLEIHCEAVSAASAPAQTTYVVTVDEIVWGHQNAVLRGLKYLSDDHPEKKRQPSR